MIDVDSLTDHELTRRLHELVAEEARCLADVLRHIAEFDRRRLHEPQGQPSCFVYCTKVLGYSESAAYKRIQAARLSREYPGILPRIETRKITLRNVLILGPHLTSQNWESVLDESSGRGRLEAERIAARLAPQPDRGDVVRCLGELPANNAGATQRVPADDWDSSSLPSTPPCSFSYPTESVHPSAPERVRFAFTGSEELLKLLQRAQDVLRHKYPAGEMEKIFLEALEALLDRKDPERRLRAKEERAAAGHEREPRPQSVWAFAMRHIPQSVRDMVWRRDGGQCVYVGDDGRRCSERGGLEYDHIVPFALGGPSNNPKNIRLLCKAHNLMLARQKLGESALRRQSGRDGGWASASGNAAPPCG